MWGCGACVGSVSVLTESEIKKLPESEKKIGIDLGIKNLIIISDGNKYSNIKSLAKHEKRLKRLQRILSRRKESKSGQIHCVFRV